MSEIKCQYAGCENRPAFSKAANLKRHIEYMHRAEYPCEYEDCSEIFSSRKDLLKHEKDQHRLRCHLCPTKYVSTTFKKPQQLRRHIRLVHEVNARHQAHFCNVCKLEFSSRTEYLLHLVKKHQTKGSGFEIHSEAMNGVHTDYRKVINTDHAPEILFSDEYYPTLVKFMSDRHAVLSHFKFNFCLTVIYESPLIEEVNEKKEDKKDVSAHHESFRKG